MKTREIVLVKLLLFIAGIIGSGVDGFHSWKLEQIIDELKQREDKE